MSTLEIIGIVEESGSGQKCKGMCRFKPIRHHTAFTSLQRCGKYSNINKVCLFVVRVCMYVYASVGPGDCAHSCIGNSTCVCFDGYKLKPDGRNCEGRKILSSFFKI